MSEVSSVYGPVKSWRLGWSLGIDVLCVDSICSFDCVYCQLGKINRLTATREIFVSTEKILEDLSKSDWQKADVITFSGSGEPTLAKNLGEAIAEIKRFTGKSISVLTNSTLLYQKEVRQELSLADKVFCKLDAWNNDILKRIDRPHQDVSLENIIEGIRLFRQDYKGFLAIQTMILRPPNSSEIEKFAEILNSIKPDEVQLNLPTRPIPHEYLTENRGNQTSLSDNFTQLKTISADDLLNICEELSHLTNVLIVRR